MRHIATIFGVLSMAWGAGADTVPLPPCVEVAPQFIELEGPIRAASAEISGMDWYGDQLVILPQYPRNELYALSREVLLAYLDDESPAPIEPTSVSFSHLDLPKRVPGFEGYEAIAFHEDRVYLAIEAREREGMAAWIASGTIDPESLAIRMDPEQMTRLPLDLPLANMSVESLVVLADGNLLAIPEANGRVVAPHSRVLGVVVSPALEIVREMMMWSIEYRITDATALRDNHFWTMNYFWPGERCLLQAPELVTDGRCLPGKTHYNEAHVERIVQMTWHGDTLQASDSVYLQLQADTPRNWEALALLEDRGFLLMTDQHPTTLLAFVPYP